MKEMKGFFQVYEIVRQGDTFYFYGIPVAGEAEIEGFLRPFFLERGFEVSLRKELGEHMLVVSPSHPFKKRRVWINLALFVATVFTTMFMGSFMFGGSPLTAPMDVFKGLPFTLAIMTVLGSHELGHYLVARRHGMQTSLPYFIPVPFPPIGTMGAVIKHEGPIPSRKVLFDVGIAGPLVGLLVSLVVAAIGLSLPPVSFPHHPAAEDVIILQLPPLFEFLTFLFPVRGEALHPVAFAGWVGMLVTAVNLIPAGQLDGGHVLRAMLGPRASRVSRVVPFLLLGLGVFVTYVLHQIGSVWIFLGIFLSFFSAAGHPPPLEDTIPLDRGRMLLGVVVFLLGLLSITLSPFQVNL